MCNQAVVAYFKDGKPPNSDTKHQTLKRKSIIVESKT